MSGPRVNVNISRHVNILKTTVTELYSIIFRILVAFCNNYTIIIQFYSTINFRFSHSDGIVSFSIALLNRILFKFIKLIL